jgi:hypothetical protein
MNIRYETIIMTGPMNVITTENCDFLNFAMLSRGIVIVFEVSIVSMSFHNINPFNQISLNRKFNLSKYHS